MRRPSRLPFLLLALGIAARLPCARADGRETVHLEQLVPAATRGFFGLRDLGPGLARRWGETGLGRLAREPEMAAYLEGLSGEVRRALDATVREAPEGALSGYSPLAADALRLLEEVDGDLAVAWISTREDDTPVLAGVVDFGPNLSDFLAFLRRSTSRAAEPGCPTIRVLPSGEHPQFRLTAGFRPGQTFHGVVVGTAVFLSNDPAWVARQADRGLEPHQPSFAISGLAGTDAWRALADDAAFVRASAIGLLHLPEPSVPRGQGPPSAWPNVALTLLGARGLVTYTAGVAGDAVEEHLTFRDAASGLLASFAADAPSRPVARVPRADPFLALVGRVRTEEVLVRVRGVLEALGLSADDVFERTLGWVASRLHVDPKREVLLALTGEFSVGLAMPETGGLYPEVVAAFGLGDPAAFERMLGRATERLCEELSIDGETHWTTRALPFHGTTLHVLEGAAVAGDERVPGMPTWMVLGDRLWLAPVPHVLKEVVLRAQAPTPVAAVPRALPPYPAPAPGAVAALLVDAGAFEGLLYDTAAPGLQSFLRPALDRSPVHGDPALLPAARVVRPYLVGQSISVTRDRRSDGNPTSLEARGPLPLLGGLIVAGALATLVRPAASEEARGEESLPMASGPAVDPRTQTQGTLLRLAAAIEEYQALQGVLPAALDDLVTQAHLLRTVPTDWWSHPIHWAPDFAGRSGTLTSYGADGLSGTADDVTVEVEPFRK